MTACTEHHRAGRKGFVTEAAMTARTEHRRAGVADCRDGAGQGFAKEAE